MLYACVKKFDLTGNLEKFLVTKHGLHVPLGAPAPAGAVPS